MGARKCTLCGGAVWRDRNWPRRGAESRVPGAEVGARREGSSGEADGRHHAMLLLEEYPQQVLVLAIPVEEEATVDNVRISQRSS
ncbi:unnamed protein product [Closterium sp. NIES-54]